MKKFLLFFFPACFYCSLLSAQVEKNAIYPELSLGRRFFSYNSNGYQTGISVGLNSHSTLGVFYSHVGYQSPPLFSEAFSKVSRYGISYTYYSYFKKSQKWGWTLNGTVSLEYAHSYYKTLGGSEISGNFRGKDISITPGAFFKLSPRIMFTGNLGGFSIYNSRYGLGTSLSSFGGELNLGVRIKLFGKKK